MAAKKAAVSGKGILIMPEVCAKHAGLSIIQFHPPPYFGVPQFKTVILRWNLALFVSHFPKTKFQKNEMPV